MKELGLFMITRVSLYWCFSVKVPGLYMVRTLALSVIKEIASGFWTFDTETFRSMSMFAYAFPPPVFFLLMLFSVLIRSCWSK